MKKQDKNQIRGTLYLQSNHCTTPMKIHPVKSGTWYLIPADLTSEEQNYQYYATSLVTFDTRQLWNVYYFRFAHGSGWIAERNGLYLRMPERHFEKYFGKYEIHHSADAE